MAAVENSTKTSCSESEDSSAVFVDRFKEGTSKLLNRFLKYFKFEDFAIKYYPEIYKNDQDLLKDTYNQFLDQLKNQIKDDVEELCKDQQLYLKLEELNSLTKESKLSEDVKAWRPSGDPSEDLRDYRYKYKLAHKKALKSLLENMRSHNDELEKEVMANHEEIMRLKETVIKQDEQNNADLSALEEVDFNMIENIEQMVDDS